MLYTDTLFLLLFSLVCLVTFLLRPWPALKEWFLIGFSLVVIMSWGTYDLALFLGILTLNFFTANALPRLSPGPSRALLIGTITFDAGTLALFKYSNFIGSTLGSLTGLPIPSFPLGIPLAISFYTFHLISYLVDVHAGRVRVATFRQYLFYLSFFPHVIAGPIVRAWQLIPQIGVTLRVRMDWIMGFHFLVVGFFLKTVVANNLADQLDPILENTHGFKMSNLEYWLVAFFYYCQIYGDFAGYSLMALGMSRLLGYRLPVNFRSPMLAASLQDFWHRWHITLSRWLRDYLYIPLGGNRGTTWRVGFNLFATMLLGGLWHGAGWGFLIWGAMHGTGLAVERFLGCGNLPRHTLRRIGWWVATQLWVTATWVVFREPSLADTWKFARHLFQPRFHWGGHPIFYVHPAMVAPLLFALPVVLHHLAPRFLRLIGRRRLGTALGLSTGILLILNLTIYFPIKTFIYFKF